MTTLTAICMIFLMMLGLVVYVKPPPEIKIIEKPVIVEKIVEKPVIVEKVVEKIVEKHKEEPKVSPQRTEKRKQDAPKASVKARSSKPKGAYQSVQQTWTRGTCRNNGWYYRTPPYYGVGPYATYR